MIEHVVTVESARGCGYRKPGASGVGIYLMGPDARVHCGRLPFPLSVCPCCGAGIKPARSWAWIEPSSLFAPSVEPHCDATLLQRRYPDLGMAPARLCASCPLGGGVPSGRHGLIWIGGKFYATTTDFMREADMMGVSRKIGALPRGFVLGETYVYLAHRKAVPIYDEEDPRMEPGVFTVFRPTRIDLVVDDIENVPERADNLAHQIQKTAADSEAANSAPSLVRIVQVTREKQTDIEDERDDETDEDS